MRLLSLLSPSPRRETPRAICSIHGDTYSRVFHYCIPCKIENEIRDRYRKAWQDAYEARAKQPGTTQQDCIEFADATVKTLATGHVESLISNVVIARVREKGKS